MTDKNKKNSGITGTDAVESIPANLINSEMLPLNVRSYAGYAGADRNAELFYWFFECQQFSPKRSRDETAIENTPLALWFNGGPGASSTLGLFLENGPYRMSDDVAGTVIVNECSWNRNMHIMYWDQPFGTGYSHAEYPDGTVRYVTDENELGEMMYNALQNFFRKHPEYRRCPLYLMGESYAGKYVPSIAQKIHDKNQNGKNIGVNLKGICVGDGWIDARLQMRVYIEYAFELGYIDTKQQDLMMQEYRKFCDALDKQKWKEAYAVSNGIVDTVSAMGGGFNPYDIRTTSAIPMTNVQSYMNLKQVKKVLNVPGEQPWNCADNEGPVAENLLEDNMSDATLKVYSGIIKKSDLYRVLLYTGTFDTACGSLSTEKILYDLPKWNRTDDRKWTELDRRIWAQPADNVKGFIKQYRNLTQIVLPNSGHQVPYYLPVLSREMIDRWISGESFPSYVASVEK